MDREEARQRGLRRYFTGKPCNHGHLCERYVSNTHCVECKRVSTVKHHRNYYLANCERLNEVSRQYYANMSGDKKAEAKVRWAKKRREYANQNRDQERLRRRRYYAANPNRYLAYVHARRARILAGGGRYTQADIERIRRAQHDRCAVCQSSLNGAGEIDHIDPLKLGGSNGPENLQFLCKPCNRAKGSKDHATFLREIADQFDLSSIDWDANLTGAHDGET